VILRWRNWWRLGAALVLPASVGVVLSPVAAGDTSSPQITTQVLVTQSTYYWREQAQAQNVGGTNVAPPTGGLTDPTVPTGDVAVAGPEVNNQTDKETYLEFDVSAVPAGSTITSFVVTLPVDPSPQAQTFAPPNTAPPIIACTPQGAWSGGANGAQSFAGKPTDQCAPDAPKFASKDGGKTYTADIASIAQGWITDINTGVAVADDPHNMQTAYQVVFGDMNAINKLTAQMTYLPGAGNTTLNTPENTTPTETIPPETLNVPLVPSGVSSTEQPPSTTPTTTAPSTNKPNRSALRAASYAGAGPPGVFWIAAVLILALLFSASLVLGDEPSDEPGRGRRRLLLAGARQFQGGRGRPTSGKED
jgi:hypothetical protein